MRTNVMGTKTLIVLALIVCLASAGTCLAGGLTIAKINLSQLNRQSKAIQRAIEDFKRKESQSRARLSVLANDLRKAQKKADEKKSKLSKEEQDKLELDLKTKREQFNQASREERVKISFARKSLQASLRGKLKAIIADIAKKNGYSAVMREDSFLYAEGIPDITAKVIAELDSAADKGAAKKPETTKKPAEKPKKSAPAKK